jgi:zinc and cadmium transporter
MSNNGLLLVYCLLILLASLAGGLVPLVIKLTHRRMQLAISLVAGFMLGVAVLHLLPHALMTISAGLAARWIVIGMMAMFFLERFFCFHHHDAPQENPPVCGHEHDGESPGEPDHTHDHACGHDDEHHVKGHEHRLGWGGAAVGLTVHSVIAGFALAAAMSSQALADAHGSGWLAGLAVFLVIFLHKPFDSLTLGTLMAAGGWPVAARHLVNGLFALAVPLGALLFYLGLASINIEESYAVGAAVAFCAGVFMVISLSDLLPELQFHHHDRAALSFALVLGVAMAWTVSHFEAKTHQHDDAHGGHTPAVQTDRVDPHAQHGDIVQKPVPADDHTEHGN